MELPVLRRLKKELEDLRFELHHKLPKEIEVAREHGDLRENAEFHAAKERQGFVNGRIGHIEQRIRDLSLYSVASIPRAAVGYGSLITLESEDGAEEKYELVFPEEVDAAAGLISIGSPLGRAMLNKEVGDDIEVATPKGKRTYSIIELVTIHERKDIDIP
ncbi:MAG: GreA/GreB family elongation factor [Deltaproteobacteria bacterium]|nr:GreA/GreB family elongation factor [Deltaproteobacteria bacterium]